jgi:hypothetical protein
MIVANEAPDNNSALSMSLAQIAELRLKALPEALEVNQ